MKILILGGTGPMGNSLVELMDNLYFEVYVTSREKRVSSGNIKYLQCNAQIIQEIKPILERKWDVIIDFMSYPTVNEFRNKKDLLLSSTNHYFFMSSARVYADSTEPIVESSPRLIDVSNDTEYLKTEEYALVKALQENLLMGSEKNWTIIRPYITYGDYRLQFGTFEKENWLYRALHRRTIIFDENMINKITTMTHSGDVARKILKLIGNPDSKGEIYQIAAPQVKSWYEISQIYLDIIQQELNYRPKVMTVDNIISSLEIQGSKYQVIYDRLYNRKFDSSKIDQTTGDLGYIDICEGLYKCVYNFLKNPQFQYINWKFEAIKDKISGDVVGSDEVKISENYEIYRSYRW